MTTIGDAWIRIRPNTAGFAAETRAGTTGIKNVLGGLGVPSALLNGWGALGLAVVGVAGDAVRLGIKMQAANAAIAASAGSSVAAATEVGNAFLKTAGHSEFSGLQMAQAYAPIAGQLTSLYGKALNTRNAIALMTQTETLAVASGQSLASVTAATANVMQTFQVPVRGAKQVISELFNTSSATGQSITSLAATFQRVKSQMGVTAPSMREMGGVLIDLTNHGETGRAAMSTLSTMFTGLIPPVGKLTSVQRQVRIEQEKYHISFKNAKGDLVDFKSIIAQTEPIIAHMGNAQAIATLQSLGFGSASKKLVQTIDAGAAVYQRAVNHAAALGTATSAAAKNSATLVGVYHTVKAAIEDWMVNSALPWLNKWTPKVKEVAQTFFKHFIPAVKQAWRDTKPFVVGIIDMVKYLAKIPGLLQGAGVALGAFVALSAFKSVLGGLAKLTGMFVGRGAVSAAGGALGGEALAAGGAVGGALTLTGFGLSVLEFGTFVAAFSATTALLKHSSPARSVANWLTSGNDWNPLHGIVQGLAGLLGKDIPTPSAVFSKRFSTPLVLKFHGDVAAMLAALKAGTFHFPSQGAPRPAFGPYQTPTVTSTSTVNLHVTTGASAKHIADEIKDALEAHDRQLVNQLFALRGARR